MATVLQMGSRQMMGFNSSRNSRHRLIRDRRLKFKGLHVELPVLSDYQLIHSYNKIPQTTKPWIVTFESLLPRVLSRGTDPTPKRVLLRKHLVSSNCRKIIAISAYAKGIFSRVNKDWDLLDDVLKKVEVIHPNVPINSHAPKTYVGTQPLQLVFIGNDFARKGGITVLRLAKKAKQMGVPIAVHLVSGMKYGPEVHTDYPHTEKYEEDLKLLSLDNVVFHGKKSNQEVLQLLSQSHFQIMPTLHDTYGYSIVEGFSVATPAITTNVCALPEFVHHGKNGYVLNLDLKENKIWTHLIHWPLSRDNQEYWKILNSTYDNLADQALQLLVEFLSKPESYEGMSAGALAQARNIHNPQQATQLLDGLYSEVSSRAA